ncbi:hypothetical protein GQ53DRAFT_610504, partial [Thozetella sp. PMI_491]
SLCINQNDMLERAAQVSSEATIYRQAVQTLIWLGPSRDDSDHAMDIVHDGTLAKMETFRFLIALVKLLHRRWFTRIWIIQEIALS